MDKKVFSIGGVEYKWQHIIALACVGAGAAYVAHRHAKKD